MPFFVKYAIVFTFFFSANCESENPHINNTPVEIDTLKKSAALSIEIADSVDHLKYPWKNNLSSFNTLHNWINPPDGYRRVEVEKGSFADWLRHLPVKDAGVQVYLFNGEPKPNQSVHAAVIDIDTGKKDLQQCADAIMRLRAEYFYGSDEYSKIHFNYTSGHKVSFDDWRRGKKPQVKGNEVSFSAQSNNIDNSYANFRKYLDAVFNYAGTASLSKEMKKTDVADLKIGDVFIQGGFPGHAVLVVDMAMNTSGQKCFLLAQSYMPAQDIHILKNFNNPELRHWYSTDFGTTLHTPEWTFSSSDLKRFAE